MLRVEKAIREYQGEEKEIRFLAGLGNFTADIEAKTVDTKKGVIAVAGGYGQSIAFNYWENGEKKVVYFPIEAWGFTAEALSKVGKRGKEVVVIGRLEDRTYTTQQNKRYINETLIIEQFQVTSRGFQSSQGNGDNKEEVQVDGFAPADSTIDDIPF